MANIYNIEWDAPGEREYETGLSNGVLYPMSDTAGVYANGVAWNGLTAVTESPEGAEPTDLWADNIKYATLRSTETFGFTVEAYMYPDEFGECDGTAEPITGLKLGQQARKNFGLVYTTKKGTDQSNEAGELIHIIYNATASPSEKAYATINDSPEAITFSWECKTTPVNVSATGASGKTYKPISTIVIDTTKVNADKLATFLLTLYGTAGDGSTTGSPATLPSPDDVIAALTPSSGGGSEEEDGN